MTTQPSLSKLIRSIHRLWISTTAVLALTGCSLAPTYERPSLPVPLNQQSGAMSAKSGDTAADVELSQVEEALISDLAPEGELQRWVRLALKYNRDYQVAALRVQEAQATYHVSRAERIPVLSASVERERQHFDNPVAQERYGQDIAIASFGASNFELDFFGRVRNLSEAARHDYLATTYGQQAARTALVTEVARAYLFEQLSAAMEVDAQRISDAHQGVLDVIEDQQKQGAMSFDDVAVQRLTVEGSHQRLADAMAAHARAYQALLLLTGYSASLSQVKIEPDNANPLLDVPTWLVDMPSQRLLDRFDIRQSEELLKAANANIGAARAAFFPSITLSTSVGVQSESLRALFGDSSGTWLFSPQLNLPLFDGGRNQSNLDLAKVRKQLAITQYEKTIQTAFREMADVLTQRRLVLDRMRSEIELRHLAQEKARRALMAFAAGAADRATILASTVSVAQADITWRQSRHELLLNRLNLYRVLCGADAAPLQSQPETATSL